MIPNAWLVEQIVPRGLNEDIVIPSAERRQEDGVDFVSLEVVRAGRIIVQEHMTARVLQTIRVPRKIAGRARKDSEGDPFRDGPIRKGFKRGLQSILQLSRGG